MARRSESERRPLEFLGAGMTLGIRQSPSGFAGASAPVRT
jgi:hypothetical protein